MKEQYLDTITFTIDGVTFFTLNIVFELFLRVIPKHSHSDKSYEIHYIPYGYGSAVIDGTEYEIVPETLYVTGPGIEHEQVPCASNPMAEYCVYFQIQGSNKQKDTFVALFEKTKFWFGKDTQNIHITMSEFFSELKNRNCGYVAQAEALLKELIVKVVRNYTFEKDSYNGYVSLNDKKLFIAEECFLYNYLDLTLNQLASRLGLGKRQTERFLQEHYGKTFSKKRIESRMSVAAIMLSQSDKSILTIADELGYSSPEHFARAFKKQYNETPSGFRKGTNRRNE